MKSGWLAGLCACIVLFLAVAPAHRAVAQSASPSSVTGQWKTLDDQTGQVKSIVTIWEQDGKLNGRVEKLLFPDPNTPNQPCTTCNGKLKGKPLVGVQILWGLTRNGNSWTGGYIMDPKNDSVYKCNLELQDGGKKLKVHGYIGISLLGRTQYWQRME